MKSIRWAVFIMVALAPLASSADTIEKSLSYRNLSGVEVSPDGKRAVFVATVADLEENTMNSDLWLVDFDSGRSFQLTRGPKRDANPRWSPDGKTIAFLSNRGGEKAKTNIWLIEPDGGEAWPATTFDKLSVSAFAWLPDGEGFIFTAADPPSDEEEKRKKDKEHVILVEQQFKYGRLYLWRLGDEEPTQLTEEDYHVTSFDLSPDGQSVVFSAQPTPKVPDFAHSDLKLMNLETRQVRNLVGTPGYDGAPVFSPDGQWIAYVSSGGRDDWNGNRFLHVVRRDGTGLRNVTQSFDERIGGRAQWSADGQWLYYRARQGAQMRLFRVEVASGRYQAVSEHDRQKTVHAMDLEAQGRFAVVAVSDPENPAEVYRLSLAAGGLEKLTAVNADFEGTGPRAELMRYRSADGYDIEGLVLKPRDFTEGTRYPLLVVIHGGPAGVFTWSFTPRRSAYPLHAFTEQGYVVFMPNPRGSGGYGERFRRANVREWGHGDYRDILQGVDLLVQQGVADPERMGVMGWSYGGYMTSWIVTQTDRFRAASMGAGLSNLLSLYGTTDIPEAVDSYFGAKPWEDAQKLLQHSAINFAGRVRTPTLIQHGQADRRVPLAQGEEFYRALKKVGVAVEMAVYPRQPHGIREPRLLREALERNLRWFNKWLLGFEESGKN